MNLGKVKGVVVSTKKHPTLVGASLYVVEPQDEKGQKTGDLLIAADTVALVVGDVIETDGGVVSEATENETAKSSVLAFPDKSWHLT